MHGKKYKTAKEKAPKEVVDAVNAVAFLQETAKGGFDQTVELHLNLGVDHTKSDQMIRATVTLPSGSAKQKKIAVVAGDAKEQAAAKAAGAHMVGGEELIAQIEKDGKIDADVVIATPAMMAKIARVARVLGPQGLMPNPKTGTVTPNPANAIKELAAGKVTFKMDSLGNIHEAVGKISWEAAKIVANVEALIAIVKTVRPKSMKGQLIKSATLKSTMSPAVRITF